MKFWLLVASGVIVLLTVVLCLVAAGTMRSGHPPASGIVVLAAFLLVGPLSGLAALLGLLHKPGSLGPVRAKWFFLATGVNLLFALFCVWVWFFKSVLGWTL